MAELARTPRARSRRPGASAVTGIVLGGMLLVCGICYIALVLWPHTLSEMPADAPSVPITIAGVVFNVPPAAIRQQVQRRSGAQERIDLVFLWPSLKPPDEAKHPQQHPNFDAPPATDRLFVTIAGTDGTLSTAERLKAIYPRYIANDLQAEGEGLVARHFRDASPYKGEDLVFDPAAPERFLTRCSRAGATPGMCLLERQVGAAAIVVRFPRDWLADWRALAGGIDDLIATLRPPVR
ncbi:MAG: hypothetical protein ACJ8DQ_05735 [Xanthobacteraceae bacterium]